MNVKKMLVAELREILAREGYGEVAGDRSMRKPQLVAYVENLIEHRHGEALEMNARRDELAAWRESYAPAAEVAEPAAVRYTFRVTRWAQETATNENGPYLTGRNVVESVELTEVEGAEALKREHWAFGHNAPALRAGNNTPERGSRRETRYLCEWFPTDEPIAPADDVAEYLAATAEPLALVAGPAEAPAEPAERTAADRLGDEAVAALTARGITLAPEVEAQVRASAASASAAAAAERARGPVLDAGIPDLMSITEIAAHYACSRQAVHDAIKAGKLPARQVGTTWVVRRELIEAAGQTIE